MRIIIPIGRLCLQLMPQHAPVSIATIRILRRISFGTDALFPQKTSGQTGKLLNNAVLRAALANDEMGAWSMSPKTLNFLETQIHDKKPARIVEMGGGLSTLCLAAYMREAHDGADGVYVCSIEQDSNVIESTMRRLKGLNLDRHVKMFHAPLSRQVIEGSSTACYTLPEEFRAEAKRQQPDFIVVDGPAAESGARFGTLPLMFPYVNKAASFYLDDALRDGEIDIAVRWGRLARVRIDGIHLTEKGLLIGEVKAATS